MSAPGGLVPVHMLQVPVRVWAASQEHVDELIREFALMTAGLQDDDTESAPVPLRLVRLVAQLTADFAGTSDAQRAQLFDAAAAGQDVIDDLVYLLPPEAAPATARLGRMLDEADDYCRDGQHLLTLATPEELVAFRRWCLGQVQDQLAGGAPVPWPDHLAASRADAARR